MALTSVQVVRSAPQSRRGSRETKISGLYTTSSSCASSASLGCSGNDLLETLQAFTAQERKLRFSTLIALIRARILPMGALQVGSGFQIWQAILDIRRDVYNSLNEKGAWGWLWQFPSAQGRRLVVS